MTDDRVLVTGATGKTGRRIAALLEARGIPFRAASRGTEPRFDWDDPETWRPALEGVGAAYILDPTYLKDRPDTAAADAAAAFLEVAREAGVERVVLLSARDVGRAAREDLLAVESAVMASDLDWTVLRPSWFMQNFSETEFLSDPVRAGELRTCTGDGREPFVDLEDLAEVAVAVLTEPGHAGRIYELTGPRPMTFGDAVAAVAEASGRRLSYAEVPSADYLAHLVRTGMSPEYARLLTMLFDWIREGRYADTSSGIEEVLGRPPREFSEYAARAATEGAWRAP